MFVSYESTRELESLLYTFMLYEYNKLVCSDDVSSGARFRLPRPFSKIQPQSGLWNLDANSSQEEPHGGIDLFLLCGGMLAMDLI